MKKYTFGLTTVLVAGVVGACAGAGGSLMETARASDTASSRTVTVFVDATFGFRKDHMARQLTESHAEFAARGYDFAGMESFTENGDLQGFFVTYTRD